MQTIKLHEIRCIKRKTKYISTHMRVFSYYTARPYMYSALVEGEIANRQSDAPLHK